MSRLVGAALVALAACGSFEDPAIVLDLRALAVAADPPEQVFDVDPADPLDVPVADVVVCGLAADPLQRDLIWEMTACPPERDLRCDPDRLTLPLTPVTSSALGSVGQVACATLPAGPALVAIVRQTLEEDSLQGFGGVDINLAVRVTPVGGAEADAIYAGKGIRFSARLPAERVANTNPGLMDVTGQVRVGDVAQEPVVLPDGGCGAGAGVTRVPANATLKLVPHPVDGAAETYVVPTFEGGARMFTENLRYQWLATAGDWKRATTGGPRDSAGNPAVVDTEWTAPAVDAGTDPVEVDLWMIMRDERGGAAWWSTCVVVDPG